MIRLFLSTALAGVLTFSTLAPVQAQSVAGAYLAGRQAAISNDFDEAAVYYVKALARDQNNLELMDGAILSFLSLGQLNRAVPIAKRLEASGERAQVAHMAMIGDLIAREDYATLAARDVETLGIGPLVDGLLGAWTLVGLGNVADGMAAFDTLAEQPSFGGFALYHKALALAQTGDFEAAAAVYEAEDAGAMNMMRRGIMARAEILSQLDRNADALEVLQQAFGAATDPELTALTAGLTAGDTVPFTHVTSVRDGHAEVFYSLADVLRGEAGPNYTLLVRRVMAQHIRPGHIDRAFVERLACWRSWASTSLAIACLPNAVPDEHAAHPTRPQLGRAAALRRSLGSPMLRNRGTWSN